MKRLLLILTLGFAQSSAWAACGTYPNTLTNGTVANADQVMANFNAVNNCAAPIANPRMSGSLSIDTASPVDKFDVAGSAVIGTGNRLSLNNDSVAFNRHAPDGVIYNSSVYAFQFQHMPSGTASADSLQLLSFTPSGAGGPTPISMTASGQVTINAAPNLGYTFYVNGTAAGLGYWTNASDARLKKNIKPISGALNLVKHLQGVSFDWRSPEERGVGKSLNLPMDEHQLGFIAQDVEKVVPQVVTPPKEIEGSIYGMKTDGLVALLVEAIKEQQVEIERLKAKLKIQ